MNIKNHAAGLITRLASGIRKGVFLIPSIITIIFVLITMSVSLGTVDTVFLSLTTVFAATGIYLNVFCKNVSSRTRIAPVILALASLLDDVICFNHYSTSDIVVLISAAVCAVYFVLAFLRKKQVSVRLAVTASALCIGATVALYATHGKLFTVQDPFLVLACFVCAALAATLTYFKPKAHIAVRIGVAAILPLTAFLLLEFLTHIPFIDNALPIFLLNTALFFLFALILFFLFGRSAPALVITVVLPLIFGLVSYFTVEFRGTPLFPWDLASYGIAATVLGGYDLTIPPTVALVCSLAVLSCTAATVFNVRLRIKFGILIRLLAVILLVSVLFSVCAYLQTDRAIADFDLYPHLFVPHHLYKMNGFAVSFLMNLRYTTVEKPEGYSPEASEKIAEEFISDSISDASVKPNVIVIMNESFADMKTLCDFETNADYMPFISSLEENTVKGTLHASIVGGNTPNSEFEFLTGMTMGYLPAGSIPYQQFMKSPRPTLATQLQSLGYHTVAMHPYWAEGWKREIVYPMMGFDEMHFLDYDTYGSFNDFPRIRDYISDEGLYDKIRTSYEEKDDSEPLFVFGVTMQNHSGYSDRYDNFSPEVKVTGLEDNFEISTYMSLVRESDAAFNGLIQYFKEADEPTVILMFGDHQPNDSIAGPLMNAAGTVYDDSDIKSSERRFTVPYVLWANYELDVTPHEDMSINYLSSLLIEAADLPMTGAQKHATHLFESYPVITGRCLMNSDGTASPVSDYVKDEGLVGYSYLQYTYLFDSDSMPADFWELKK